MAPAGREGSPLAKEGIARSFQDSVHSAVEGAVLLVHLNSAYKSLLEISQLGGTLSSAEFDRYLMSLQLARFLGTAGNRCALSMRSDTLGLATQPDTADHGRSPRRRVLCTGGYLSFDVLPCVADAARWLDQPTQVPRVNRVAGPYLGRPRRSGRRSSSTRCTSLERNVGFRCRAPGRIVERGGSPRGSGVSEARSPH
jgi:hypothetical protein